MSRKMKNVDSFCRDVQMNTMQPLQPTLQWPLSPPISTTIPRLQTPYSI
jgi:hypothetical protein